VLITNLMDEQAFPACEFKELYHLRWGAEENYKRLKRNYSHPYKNSPTSLALHDRLSTYKHPLKQ
jgi:hypothetical protein